MKLKKYVEDEIKILEVTKCRGNWTEYSHGQLDMLYRIKKLKKKKWAEKADEIDKLANFIMKNVPGEPSRDESAVETAIRLIGESNR